jgi:hypothetical protein
MPLLGPDGNTPVVPAPEPAAPAIKEVVTAFLVYQLPNGAWALTPDINEPVVPARPPSLHDIFGAAANIQADITAQRSASMTVGTLDQREMQARAMALSPEQAAAAQAVITGRR